MNTHKLHTPPKTQADPTPPTQNTPLPENNPPKRRCQEGPEGTRRAQAVIPPTQTITPKSILEYKLFESVFSTTSKLKKRLYTDNNVPPLVAVLDSLYMPRTTEIDAERHFSTLTEALDTLFTEDPQNTTLIAAKIFTYIILNDSVHAYIKQLVSLKASTWTDEHDCTLSTFPLEVTFDAEAHQLDITWNYIYSLTQACSQLLINKEACKQSTQAEEAFIQYYEATRNRLTPEDLQPLKNTYEHLLRVRNTDYNPVSESAASPLTPAARQVAPAPESPELRALLLLPASNPPQDPSGSET